LKTVFLYPFFTKILILLSSSHRERLFYKPFEEKFVPSLGSQRKGVKTATFSYLFLLLNRKQKICPAKISSQVVATEKAQKGQRNPKKF
jgi:hypothetical protein